MGEAPWVDWGVVATVAAPLIALFVGVALNKALESKPILVVYYGHTSSFKLRRNVPEPIVINTHVIVLRNVGRKPARNVRLGHNTLPDFQINPNRQYKLQNLTDGGKEIVFTELVPGEQIHISYLYSPPIVYGDVNTYAKSDEGFAKFIQVELTQQYGKAVKIAVASLMLIGLITMVYLLWELTVYLVS